MQFSKNKVVNVAFMVVLLNIIIAGILAFIYRKDNYGIIAVFLVLAVLSMVEVVVGIVMAIRQDTRTTGQGILLGALIILLFGGGVCTLAAMGIIK